jgi:uncharacterized repeat protein (TIGR01451 family)
MIAQTKTSLLARALSIVIIIGMLATPLTIVHSASGYKITGTMVDEDGSYLSGATLKVYTESYIVSGDPLLRDYVTNTTTNDEGYFKLVLYGQSYTVIIEKSGYQAIEFTIDISSTTGFTYEMDPITMEKSLSISTTTSTLLIHDGESFSIPLTIANSGDDETASITVVSGNGYSTSVFNSENQLVQSVFIASGSSAPLTLKVVAPTNAADTDLTVKVASSVEVDYVVHLVVVEAEGSALSCTYSGRSVMPSESVDFTVVLENPLYYTKTLQLSLESPEFWTFYVKNGDGQQINSVTLGAGESVSLHVTGDVPYNTTAGDYLLYLKAAYDGTTNTLPLNVTVNVKSPELTITSKYPSQTVALGGTATYAITITNPGTKQLVNLKAEGVPSGWTVVFKTSAGLQINSLLISSDSYEDIEVVVTPALDSTNAEYSITVTAYSDYTSGKIVLAANIGGSFSLDMSVDSLYFETNAASTTTDVITLTNTGYSSINNLELEITSPDGWDVTVTPIKITTLEPNSKATFTLSITPPSGTSAKDYLVKVTATSDEISTDMQSIRVTVNVESSWSIYGIVLLAVGAGIFVLIYKKLKRK